MNENLPVIVFRTADGTWESHIRVQFPGTVAPVHFSGKGATRGEAFQMARARAIASEFRDLIRGFAVWEESAAA